MMRLVVLFMLFATSLAAPAAQSMTFHDDGSYRFYYETGEEGGSHSRSEVRNPDGVVIGKFSYQDPDGDIREVSYRADESGFVAKGDVGVKGAPKGQFPVTENNPHEQAPPENADVTTVVQPEEPKSDKPQKPQAEATHHVEPHYNEEEYKDDMQDLALEETAALDDPPEGFPPGFFLQKFQGLRRFPEPTKKETPVTTESPKEKPAPQPETKESTGEGKNEPEDAATATEVKPGEPNLFVPLKPFHGLSPQEWASTMFHQPVYVFSYNQPESYGYHYFF